MRLLSTCLHWKNWLAVSMYVSIICSLLFLKSWQVSAGELIAEYSTESFGGFLTKEGEKTLPAYWPTEEGDIFSRKLYTLYVREGFLGLGIRHHEVSDFDYSAGAAQFTYYQLLQKDLPETITGIDSTVTMYHREDYLVDLYLERGKFKLTTGYQLMVGTDLFRYDLARGSVTPTPDKLIPYHLEAKYSMWKGYSDDIGHGDSFHVKLDYQWNDTLTLRVLGEDLFGELYWQKIDEYHGTLSTQLVSVDENGQTMVHAPMEGVYLANGLLKIKQPARWRGEVRYKPEWGEVTNWIQYQDGWGFGVKGALQPESWPHLSLGLARQHGGWMCEVGVGRPLLQVGLAANLGGNTAYSLNVQMHFK